ncbi:MAG TPA: hypothetical protein VGO41_07020 [Steroidobacteraceae bacterium]|jgi:hypothetical protein|nr:hypothetical protein [Steroidobacteraceae bacterium]
MTVQSERRQALLGWTRHFGLAVAAYLLAYAGAMWAWREMPPGALRALLMLLPVAPGLFLIWNGVRWYRRCDEFIRLRILQAVAVTTVVTAVWTLVYGYLELLGLPHLSVALVHTVGWPVFIVQMVRLIRSAP